MIADKQEKEAMKRMIALLDIPLPEATSKINVYFLEYADATELSKVLEGMITGISSQAKTGQAIQPASLQRVLLNRREDNNFSGQGNELSYCCCFSGGLSEPSSGDKTARQKEKTGLC